MPEAKCCMVMPVLYVHPPMAPQECTMRYRAGVPPPGRIRSDRPTTVIQTLAGWAGRKARPFFMPTAIRPDSRALVSPERSRFARFLSESAYHKGLVMGKRDGKIDGTF